ncbi:MAG: hypothetical protein ABIL58_17385 [Pseudomonadota bacterium]
MEHTPERIPDDRRSGKDRRQSYDLDYFISGGVERRRQVKERRLPFKERRRGWIRINPWRSVFMGGLA